MYGYLRGVPRASSCEKISPRGLLSAELRCARCRRQLARGEPARDRRSRRRQHTGQLRGRAASKMYGRHGSSMIVLGCVLEGSDMAHQRALGAELAPPWLRPAAETTASWRSSSCGPCEKSASLCGKESTPTTRSGKIKYYICSGCSLACVSLHITRLSLVAMLGKQHELLPSCVIPLFRQLPVGTARTVAPPIIARAG